MNLNSTGTTIRLRYLMSILIIVFWGLQSCAKKENETIPSDEKVQLSIQISGVNLPTITANKATNIQSSILPSSEFNTIQHVQTTRENDFIIDVISEQGDIVSQIGNQNITSQLQQSGRIIKKASLPNIAAAVNMDTGVKYRFMLYNKVTGAREASVLATAGQQLQIDVVKGHNFYWYAYSYNSTEDIEDPTDKNNPELITPIDKPLLYASGEISPILGSNRVAITFNHQLTQLKLNINTRHYFASIINLNAEFVDDYVKTSTFNIRSGLKTGTMTPISLGSLNFVDDDEGSTREKTIQYYTADESLTAYQLRIAALDIQHPNRPVESIISKLPDGGVATFGNYTSSNKGNILQGNLKLWLVLPQKSILHFGTIAANRGYEASAGSTSGYFVRSAYNFSPTSNYFKIHGFTHREQSDGNGRLAAALADHANYPDIVICGLFSSMNAADYTALDRYIKNKGVVFLMTESTDTDLRNFFRTLFNNNTIALDRHDGGGAVYKLLDIDADVTDGAFGDIRGHYWGQDRSSTQYTTGINPNDIVAYTASAANYGNQVGVTMFRHKLLNLFFVGDTGFLASTREAAGGAVSSNTSYPFATVGGTGANIYFPVSKTFGRASASGSPESGKSAGSWQASNSIIFANALSWMLERAHFDPVDRTP